MTVSEKAEGPRLVPVFRTPAGYLLRALAYLVVSSLALLGGYLIGSARAIPPAGNWILLGIPLGASGLFALGYSICFHRDDGDGHADIRQRQLEDVIVALVCLIYVETSLLLVVWHQSLSYTISNALGIAFGLHALICLVYSITLLWRYRSEDQPHLRHLLAWPAVLIIANNLQIGIVLGSGSDASRLTMGLLVLIGWFLISELRRLSRRPLVWWSLGALLVAAMIVFASRFRRFEDLAPVGLTLGPVLFTIALAAYLSVSEAFQLTARLAQQEFRTSNAVIPFLRVATWSRTRNFYLATLAVLVFATWLVPLFYSATDGGVVFLLCFAAHALCYLWWWKRRIATPSSLIGRRWWLIKTTFAGTVLGAIYFDWQFHVVDGFVMNTSFRTFLAGLSTTLALVVGARLRSTEQFEAWTRAQTFETTRELIARRLNAARLLVLACWLGGAMVMYGLGFAFPEGSSNRLRMDAGLAVYTLIILVIFVVDFVSGTDDPASSPPFEANTTLLSLIAAGLSIVRAVSAVLVGSMVGLGLFLGGMPWSQATLCAAPFVLAVMGGGAINDFFDRERDAVNKPWRAIPAGVISPDGALRLAITLLSGSVATAIFANYSRLQLGVFAATLGGVVVYNIVVRYAPVAKTFFTGILCALPMVLVLDYVRAPLMSLCLAMVAFIAGRELLMDVLDIHGDRLARTTTLPCKLGTRFSTFLGFALQGIGLLVLTFAELGRLDLAASLVHALAAATTATWAILWFVSDPGRRRNVIYGMWITLACELFVVLRGLSV
ncbi:MAG: UbiA family prenyltransferase [Vicinamibacterales bacterium]